MREKQLREFITNLETVPVVRNTGDDKKKTRTAQGHGVCLKGGELKLGKVALAETQVGQQSTWTDNDPNI